MLSIKYASESTQKTLATKGRAFLTISSRPQGRIDSHVKYAEQETAMLSACTIHAAAGTALFLESSYSCPMACSLPPTEPWVQQKEIHFGLKKKKNRISETWWTVHQLYLKWLCSEIMFKTSSSFNFAYLQRGTCCSFYKKGKSLAGKGWVILTLNILKVLRVYFKITALLLNGFYNWIELL